MFPLKDKRILITRTRNQASDLAAQLEELGATPILVPTIEIIPPESYAPLDTALAHLNNHDWLLFTSANAVEVFHRRLNLQQPRVADPSQLPREGWITRDRRESHSAPLTQNTPEPPRARFPKIAVIGPATARAVQSIGLTVDLIPPQYVAESLVGTLMPHARTVEGEPAKMLLIRAEQARDILPEALTAAGAIVTVTNAYRNQIPPDSIPALQHLFSTLSLYPDAITFTSASTATNLFALLEATSLTLPPNILLASIGPITSRTLRDLGHPPTAEATEPTIPALIQSLLAYLK
jgi:uroporphyrinogen-III synthase